MPKKPELISASLRAITQAFPGDKTTPGLVLAYLPSGEFYASIARYPRSSYGPEPKQIVVKATAISWESAVKQIMIKFLEGPEVLNTLKKALS